VGQSSLEILPFFRRKLSRKGSKIRLAVEPSSRRRNRNAVGVLNINGIETSGIYDGVRPVHSLITIQ